MTETQGAAGTIQWPAIPGETYRVEYTDDLEQGTWIPLATFVAQRYREIFTDPAVANGAGRVLRDVLELGC